MKGHLLNGEFTVHPTVCPSSNKQRGGHLDLEPEPIFDGSSTRCPPVAGTQVRFRSLVVFYNCCKWQPLKAVAVFPKMCIKNDCCTSFLCFSLFHGFIFYGK